MHTGIGEYISSTDGRFVKSNLQNGGRIQKKYLEQENNEQ